MSLLSVHMGLDEVCQQRDICQSPEDMDEQEELMATGGRCTTVVRMDLFSLGTSRIMQTFLIMPQELDFNLQMLVLIQTPSEWKARAAFYGGNTWEEAKAAAGRKESEKGSF